MAALVGHGKLGGTHYLKQDKAYYNCPSM